MAKSGDASLQILLDDTEMQKSSITRSISLEV